MKQRIITTGLAFLLLASATPAFAQGLNLRVKTEAEVKMEGKNASSTENREDLKDRMGERKASSTERRIEVQQSVAKRLANHAKEMFGAMINRLEKLADRVQSRIEKVKSAGGNTTESERFLADARVHISEAKTSLEAFVSVDLSADKLTENFSRIRGVGTQVKTHLKEAHTALVKAVRALKMGFKGSATTTVEVEN